MAQDFSRLYYSAIAPREGCGRARDWLEDHFNGEEPPRDLLMASGIVLVELMEQHYPGGYRAFLAHKSNLRHGA